MSGSSSESFTLGQPKTQDVCVVAGNIDIGTVTSVTNVAIDGTGATPDTIGVVGSTGNRLVIASDGSHAVTGAFFQATQPVSGSVSVSNLPATQPVSGSVSVSNFPATQPVSGTFFQATQPVSGTVSVGNIPHVIVDTAPTTAVTGTFFQATQPVSGSVSVSNVPHVIVDTAPTTAVTGTFFQATQPVSGTFFQATQPVSGTFFQATQPVSAASLPLPSGAALEAGNLATIAALAVAQGATTTPAGPLIQGLVNDTPSTWIDGEIRPISITAEGRVRVSSVPAMVDLDFFGRSPQIVGDVAHFTDSPWGDAHV